MGHIFLNNYSRKIFILHNIPKYYISFITIIVLLDGFVLGNAMREADLRLVLYVAFKENAY